MFRILSFEESIEITHGCSIGPASPSENRLLAALLNDDYERFLPHLANVSFALGEVVYEFGGQLDYVYCPTTANSLAALHDGKTAQAPRWD